MRTPQVDALPGMTPLGLAEGEPHKGDTMTTAQSTEDALPATIVELIVLGDDGTMDTVVYCTQCGEEFRGTWDDDGTDDSLTGWHSLVVDWLIADVTAEHECPKKA